MQIDAHTVARLANLCRIAVPEDERVPLAAELSKILSWVDQLKEVDVDGIAPMASVVETHLRWREDAVNDGNDRDAILQNAPQQQAGFFVVPKVVE